ncbi:hypothetical protein LH464_19090 [Neorhizobium sp. T786]|uniref:hypothetical protein n=1 Tax=Pseudorhizobium xiangyangii TaxID=2883104 RepID=UPI001CFF7BC2|nr:hypothetical protein [Neorhizobium xiangyangii]MCB5204576.1 hypothetical protein [Neorhizobium xiangyangii]
MAEEIDHLSDAAIALDDTLIPKAASTDPITDDIPEDVIEVPVERAVIADRSDQR